jgi:phosphonate ABC transporter permease subunit PhnE
MMAATRYDHGGAQGRWHWTAPRPEGAMGWVAYAATALAIAWVLHWSAGGAQMSWGELARGMPQIADFLSRSVPPDWSILPRLWAPALETVQIAVWGTLLSVLLALPLSFIAAGNLHGWHWLRRATRQFLNVVRSINELILALVFVSAVGLGPFPGVLALALHGMGMLGKFFAESIEEIDDGPLQALRSAGATQLQLIVFGVIPGDGHLHRGHHRDGDCRRPDLALAAQPHPARRPPLTSSHPFHFKDQFVWTYHNPVAVHAAPGSLDRLPGLLAGRDCLLVTFPEAESLGLVQRLRQLLGSQLRGVVDGIAPNPDVRWLAPLYDRVHREHADVPCIVALGGGSAIDSAKALMCATPSQTFAELLQALEQGLTLPAARHKALIAIPTTAGTGSEVTPWATIWDQAAGRKHSLHQRWTWPEAAIIDAQLMQSLPAAATLASGLDALSHAMEAIWNRHRNPVSTSLAVQAARRTLATLPALMKDLGSLPLRNRMAEAALMAGLAFSNTRTALAQRTASPARSACRWCWRWPWAPTMGPMRPCCPSSMPPRAIWPCSACAASSKAWAWPPIPPAMAWRSRNGSNCCIRPHRARAAAISSARWNEKAWIVLFCLNLFPVEKAP